jgi:hypothetical protein
MKMQEQSHIMRLIEPDAFLDDWYGWLTNQAGHIVVGVKLAFWMCIGAFFVTGELPYRADVFLVCLLGYLFFEVYSQEWQGYDTIEDTVFVVGYGTAAPLYTFHEVSAGSLQVTGLLTDLIPFFAVATIHLACGVAFRYYRAIDNKG